MRIFKHFSRLPVQHELDSFFETLTIHLHISPMLNRYIDCIIADTIKKELSGEINLDAILNQLLELCIKFCSPYIYHPILVKYRFMKNKDIYFNENIDDYSKNPLIYSKYDSCHIERKNILLFEHENYHFDYQSKFWDDFLKSEYINHLKEHIAISFYYSFLTTDANDDKPDKKKEMRIDEFADISYICTKFVKITPNGNNMEFLTYEDKEYSDQRDISANRIKKSTEAFLEKISQKAYIHLPIYLSDNLGYPSAASTFLNPKIVDSSMINSLASKTTKNPYADIHLNKKRYKYTDLYEFIDELDDMPFQRERFLDTPDYRILTLRSEYKEKFLPYETETLYNNYLTERLFNFDFISFLIKKYTFLVNNKPEFEQAYRNVFLKLADLTVLPNVFSRTIMAKELLKNINSEQIHSDLFVSDIDFLKNYLLNCTFPVLNTVFLYMICYYCNQKKSEKSSEIPKLFDSYIKNKQNCSHWHIYKKHPSDDADIEIKKHIKSKSSNKPPKYYSISSINSYGVEDKYNLFKSIYTHIFLKCMAPTRVAPIFDSEYVYKSLISREISENYAKKVNFLFENPFMICF